MLNMIKKICSNLHTYLGIKNTNLGIGSFISKKNLDFSSLILNTHFNLSFIPGDVLIPGVADLKSSQKKKNY